MKRIFKTDFPKENQDFVEKFGTNTNGNLEPLYNAMASNIDLENNIYCTVKDITFKVDASGIPTTPVAFTVTTRGTIKGVNPIRAVNLTNSTTYPNGAPFISYSQDGTIINVLHVTGLPANNNFQLTVIAWG